MKAAPTVSILMTSYNREQYIALAIESVLQSSFEDFELIVVDDGSTDATVEIAKAYETRDARVRVHQNPENLGDYVNRNRAAELASGRYLKYLDSDDAFYPFGLEFMVGAMEGFPEAALAFTRPPLPDAPYPVQISPVEAYREHFLGQGLFYCGPTGAILRATAFRAAGGFSGKRYVGDTEMWLKLSAAHPMVKLMDGLVWWRRHEQQEINLGTKSLAYAKWSYIIALDALTAPGCPLSAAEKAAALHRLKRGEARSIVRRSLRNPQAGYRVLRESALEWHDVVRYVARPR